MIQPINRVILLLCLLHSLWAYKVPDPNVTAYSRGIEISIPHEDGITAVAFSTGLSKEIVSLSHFTWRCEFSQCNENGSWTYQNFAARPQLGDILNCLVVVSKNGIDYVNVNHISITNIHEGTPIKEYVIPEASFRVHRKDFEISIPHENGIESVFFSGLLRSKFKKQTWGVNVVREENGRWTAKVYFDDIHLGDTLNYFVFAKKNGKSYMKENLTYTFEHIETSSC